MIKNLFFFLVVNISVVNAQVLEEPMVAPLQKGQVAPFSGVILNKVAVSKVIIDQKTRKEGLQIEVDKAVSDALSKKNKECSDTAANLENSNSQLEARLVTFDKTLTLKQQEIDSLKKQLESAPDKNLWLGIGFTGGVVFTLLTVFATSQVAK